MVAEDRYSARDALELIDVEYDILEPVVNARKALDPEAPVIRDDLKGKTNNHCFDWETGDDEATEAVFGIGRGRGDPGDRLPPRPPGPHGDLRLCGRLRPGRREAHAVDDVPGAPRPPDGLRPGVGAAGAQDPGDLTGYRRRVRQQGPHLPRLCLRHRRLLGAQQAGQVDGGPLGEPDQHRLRPGLHHAGRDRRHQGRQDPGHPQPRPGRPRRLQRHGGPGQVPGRLLRGLHRELRPPGRLLQDDRRLYQQGPRRRGLRLLVPDHRGGVLRRASRRLPRRRAQDGPGRTAVGQLHQARAVPLHDQDRLGVRLGQLPSRHASFHGDGRLRRTTPGAGRKTGSGAS